MSRQAAATDLLRTLHDMGAAQLSPGASGNISVRVEGGMLISASGAVAATASNDDLAFVPTHCRSLEHWPDDQPRPSSEWRMHQALYSSHPDRHTAPAGAVPFSLERPGILLPKLCHVQQPPREGIGVPGRPRALGARLDAASKIIEIPLATA